MAAIQMAKAVERAEKLFEVLNDRFYNGEIAKAAITFAPDGGRNAYGWVTVQKVWQAGGERFHELNLCAEYLDMPIQEIAGIMLHEMAHLYNLQHGIEDTICGDCGIEYQKQ